MEAAMSPSSSQKQRQPTQPTSTEDQSAMEELMKPGPEHRQLARFVGSWDVALTHWMKEGEPPKHDKGTAEIEAVFDGKYLCEEFSCELNGKPFSGVNTTGYDRVANEFVSVWYDSMGTGITRLTGKASRDGRDITFHGTMMCQPDAPMQVRHVIAWEADDRFSLTMYNSKDGKERKGMQIIYTRRK
jgi:hypothetical protein